MAAAKTALELAAAALARRDRSASTLAAYLVERGIAPAEAERAVERLEAAGYVDDARFATTRAESLASRGRGNASIREELERQGVPREHVAAAVAALAPECERAAALLDREGRSARTARRLLARGFDPETVEAALGDVC
jgi:regulatory protein